MQNKGMSGFLSGFYQNAKMIFIILMIGMYHIHVNVFNILSKYSICRKTF